MGIKKEEKKLGLILEIKIIQQIELGNNNYSLKFDLIIKEKFLKINQQYHSGAEKIKTT